jgi:uncharacterized protein
MESAVKIRSIIEKTLLFLLVLLINSCGSTDTVSEPSVKKSDTKQQKEAVTTTVKTDYSDSFVEAVRIKNMELVNKALKNSVNVNVKGGNGSTALHWAALNGDFELVEKLIKAGADVNSTDGYRDEPVIMWAVKKGHGKIVELLVENGAEVNLSDRYKETPLMDAARYGHESIARFLLHKRGNVNDVTVNGESALMFAASNGHTEVVKTLMEYGADINKIHFKTSETALAYARKKGNKDIIQIITRRAKVEGDLIKRPPRPDDEKYTNTPPDEETLRKAWGGREDSLPSTLNARHVTAHMNRFLPDITKCYQNRLEQGDRNLMGTMELMVRVAGSGEIIDIHFTTEKYQSSLFGDCILDAVKSKSFPMFYDGMVEFKYSYSI